MRVAAEKARHAHMSLAEWIGVRIAGRRGAGERDEMGYPCGWFERTCGSLMDMEDFREPADLQTCTVRTFVAANTPNGTLKSTSCSPLDVSAL